MLLDENFNLKICDFGFASDQKNSGMDSPSSEWTGTERYQAPEILEKRPYLGWQVDLFALGISLFMMLAGDVPFKTADV